MSQSDAPAPRVDVRSFRLVKRDPVTKEPHEIITGDGNGITNIWKKGQDDATDHSRA
jgi:hypothetical protein